MEKAYRIIAVILAIGAVAQIVSGFSEYIFSLDAILKPGIRPTNPTSFEMFGTGLTGITSAAPTLLIAAIFYHMKMILGAIARNN
ncbi:MAG: hypothetical protein P1U89_17535 [Verrucomicrobiales bacterium]|nr:hypothetical protein [Verrucomicrobiales bacterium]